jgi:PKD repeat protein
MTLPEKTTYPQKFDTEFELKTVFDSLSSPITNEIVSFDPEDPTTFDWENGQGIIGVENIDQWPNSGFVTVYLTEHYGQAIERATLFHYADKDENSLINLSLYPGQKIKYFPEGSIAVQNVVAQNHNFSKDSVLSLQKYLGNRGTIDQSTIEFFAEFYRTNVKVPKVWLSITPAHLITSRSFEERTAREIRAFTGDYLIFEDRTSRIKPGFDLQLDTKVQWIFQLGDGTKIVIKLDSATEEYVFEISSVNENGTVSRSERRKKEWDRKIYHRYEKQGVYDVFLTVYNENGKDELKLFNIVRVMDEAPKSLTLTLSSTSGSKSFFETQGTSILTPLSGTNRCRALAIEDTVNVSSILDVGNLEVSKWIWDFGPLVDKDSLISKPTLNLTFSAGGLYDVGLKVVTKSGSYIGAFIENSIDIVEKPSVWLGYNTRTSGDLYMNEYSINANSWKENGLILNFNYSFDLQGSDKINYMPFFKTRGFHSKPLTNDSYLLWAPNTMEVNTSKYNSISNSTTKLQGLMRLYNWFTLYLPVNNTDKIYILAGLVDVNNFEDINQEISFYEISTDTYKTENVELITTESIVEGCDPNSLSEGEECPVETLVFASSFNDARKLLKNPKKRIAEWKTANLNGLGYLFRKSENGIFDDFFEFSPSGPAFKTIQTVIPFAKREMGFGALVDGLYVISNAGDLFKFEPETKTWSNTTIASQRNYTEAFYTEKISSRDPESSLIIGTESRTSNASNTNLYFSYNYGLDGFGKFDAVTLSFSKLSSRPTFPNSPEITDQWGMNVH